MTLILESWYVLGWRKMHALEKRGSFMHTLTARCDESIPQLIRVIRKW